MLLKILTLVLFLVPYVSLAGDLPRKDCEVIDHSGGYICPPTDAQVRDYNQWMASRPRILLRDVVAEHGQPMFCERLLDGTPVACSEVDQRTFVSGRIYSGDEEEKRLLWAATKEHFLSWIASAY